MRREYEVKITTGKKTSYWFVKAHCARVAIRRALVGEKESKVLKSTIRVKKA